MYAKTEEEFDKQIQKTKKECDGYGYAECVEWSKQEAQNKFELMQQSLHGVGETPSTESSLSRKTRLASVLSSSA